MAPARKPIKQLSATVASQIAAGEVIERPASVVKELVENALDAAATRVTIELQAGGIELIRVTDDGTGIPESELPLALTAHATSKIASLDDLDHIATMGFRGEAIASIASVARLSIRSRTRNADSASVIVAEAGAVQPIKPSPGPYGTAAEVRNLFFATPARRKFLKSPQTERGRCLTAVKHLAMANPSVGFSLVSDGKAVIDLAPEQSPRDRVLDILGRELEPQLLEAHADDFDDARGLTLWGLIGKPEIARPTAIAQHVFVSGRPVKDRTIQHALRDAYRGLMEHSRFPTAVLMLEMSPEAVDVNVHPAKAEVRFRDSGHVHSVVFRAVKDALRSADLTPLITPQPRSVPGTLGSGASESQRSPSDPKAFAEFFTRQLPATTEGRLSYEALRNAMEGVSEHVAAPKAPHAETASPAENRGTAGDQPASSIETQDESLRAGSVPSSDAAHHIEPKPSILQVHNSYVVTQDDEGVVIVDQHALHERVMFEYLMERLSRGPLESQRLLTPETVDASPAQVEALDSLGDLLARIGIEAAPIGPTAVGVHAFPSFLHARNVGIRPFMSDLLERAAASTIPPSSEEALRDVVDMMSCKAAVKAGDRLGGEELARLLELRDEVERSSSCPHGRPTSVRLTLAQLERLFHRT
ncbi:MAG: DNA mismatch repair endonuclease MutL [Planctomycetota bacterium]